MPDNKPVVVATDGSDHSLRVLPHAVRLAKALGREIEMLRVVEVDEITQEPGENREAAINRTKASVEAAMAADLKHFGVEGVASTILASEASPAKALLDATSRAQILAMHSRGRGGLARLLHGSVAIDVLKGAGFPLMLAGPNVLAPRAGADDGYHLLITTDFSADADHCLEMLAPLVELGRFKVTLLNVHLHAPAGLDNDAQLAEQETKMVKSRALLPQSAEVETIVRDIPIGAGIDTAIMEVAGQVGADAIGIATHGHSAQHHLLMGSVALSILSRSHVPLIVARAKAG